MARHLKVRRAPRETAESNENRRAKRCMSARAFPMRPSRRKSQPIVTNQIPLFTSHRQVVEKYGAESIPFKFIDLFAGIGGFRTALERLGGECSFSSEWDKYSQRTYKAWFGDTPHGDIRTIKPADIPDHDLLAAGFPCQPFSLAGVSKKNSLGHAHGFKCANQGNLFFYLANIIELKRPPIFFLENVKNLQSHDQGRTWKVITERLNELNYKVFTKVIDASAWVPQHRERVYIIGFDRREFGDDPPFEFPSLPPGPRPKLSSILETNPDSKYTLSRHLWSYLQEYAERHRAKGNGFGFGMADREGITRTLSARYHKDGSEILIPQGRGKAPRRLTPNECAKLMGFDPDTFKIVVSDTQAYRQFGNAVVPPVVEAVGKSVLRILAWKLTQRSDSRHLRGSAARAS